MLAPLHTRDGPLHPTTDSCLHRREDVAEVQVFASTGFTLTELALQGERCFEWATVDMQAVYEVSMIR